MAIAAYADAGRAGRQDAPAVAVVAGGCGDGVADCLRQCRELVVDERGRTPARSRRSRRPRRNAYTSGAPMVDRNPVARIAGRRGWFGAGAIWIDGVACARACEHSTFG